MLTTPSAYTGLSAKQSDLSFMPGMRVWRILVIHTLLLTYTTIPQPREVLGLDSRRSLLECATRRSQIKIPVG